MTRPYSICLVFVAEQVGFSLARWQTPIDTFSHDVAHLFYRQVKSHSDQSPDHTTEERQGHFLSMI